MRTFIDSNIFVHAADARYPEKRGKAKSLLLEVKSRGDVTVISTQVMQEFFQTATRKLSISAQDAIAELRVMAQLETVLVRPAIILSAAELTTSASISIWDALIVTAAQTAGCNEVWTEDMQDGRKFGELEIVNPLVRR